MPTQDWGVYPDSLTAGTEVSSTYEGRHITATADELNQGNVLALVTKGAPVIFGIIAGNHGVGVALKTEVAGTDLIAIDTEGIWNLEVNGNDDLGASLVTGGDPLYINTTTAVISKIRDNATQIPFGYALGQVNGGDDDVIAVKVHWDPRSHWLEDQEKLYFGDGADASIEWNETFLAVAISAASKAMGIDITIAASALADGYGFIETNLNVDGAATGYTATRSDWLNLGATYVVLAGGGLITPHTDGIYMDAAAVITDATIALIGKFTDQMDESDFAVYNLWNLNLTQTLTALFEVNNPALMGYVATPAANAIGSIPFFHTGGGGHKYIMLYSDPA